MLQDSLDVTKIVGAVIASIGGLKYLYDTIKGRAQPNRVTWLKITGVNRAAAVYFYYGTGTPSKSSSQAT